MTNRETVTIQIPKSVLGVVDKLRQHTGAVSREEFIYEILCKELVGFRWNLTPDGESLFRESPEAWFEFGRVETRRVNRIMDTAQAQARSGKR